MIHKLFLTKKALFFVGGAAAAIIGSKCLKSETTRNLCVKGLAAGMRLRDEAIETFQNIKEEAADVYHDAKKKAKEDE